MAKRGSAIIVLVGLMLAVFAFGVAWAEKYETKSGEVESDIKLEHSDVFENPKRGPVMFSHRAHHEDYTLKCTSCHHEYDEGENQWTEGDTVSSCADCHDTPYKNVGKMPSLHQAFHKNCIQCHKATDSAPTACADCHE
jgi:hypothetical protein